MVEINWKPDKDSSISLYKQIVNYIKTRICQGDWSVGTRLPSQRSLADTLDVNRSTIVEALDELKSEGLIEGNGRAGTRVVNNTWSLMASIPPPNWHEYVATGIFKPNKPTIQVINKLEFADEYIRLGTGEISPDLYPKNHMKRVLHNLSEHIDSLGYEEPKGSLELREELCKHLRRYGIETSVDCILIVSGAIQALQLISIGIMHPNSKVLLENPSYLKSLHMFESVGIRLKGIGMDNSGVKVDEVVSNKSKSNTTVLYTIPTFHNPTGNVMTERRRQELISVCESQRIPIIEDDVYRELYIDDAPPKPLKSMDKSGNVLYLGSVSKSFAPGLRIGWIVGPQTVIERLGDIKMQQDYGASSMSQSIVAEILRSGVYYEYLDSLRDELRERRKTAIDALNKYFKDIGTWKTPKGGFYIWLKLSNNISINRLFELCIERKLLINPGNIYDFKKNNCIRISYAYASKEDLTKGLEILADIIKNNIYT